MTPKLDYRLDHDCIKLGYIDDSLLLLMNNSEVPWFILIPDTTTEESDDEFDLLSRDKQIALLDQINLVSQFMRKQYHFDKLNIATIGNVVRQLHIHIVARSTTDFCWPNVVWGVEHNSSWEIKEVSELVNKLLKFLPNNFEKL